MDVFTVKMADAIDEQSVNDGERNQLKQELARGELRHDDQRNGSCKDVVAARLAEIRG